MYKDNVILLLSDAMGVNIPAYFVTVFEREKWSGISDWAWKTCAAGPDTEHYWDAWEDILRDATYTAPDGRVYHLHQDGDLWALCYEHMSEDESENFGFNGV
jgi:hypothetical protein